MLNFVDTPHYLILFHSCMLSSVLRYFNVITFRTFSSVLSFQVVFSIAFIKFLCCESNGQKINKDSNHIDERVMLKNIENNDFCFL